VRRRAAWLVGLGVTALAAWWIAPPAPRVPAFEAVRAGSRPSDLALLDRHGEAIHAVRVDPTRRRLAWTPLAAISPALMAAVIESEDRRFYRHGGVDPRALAAAAWQSVTGGPPRGASTLTMQVAALTDRELRRRGGPRTLGQKWRQMRLAWGLEARWTKSQILETYLNLASFRGELEGVAAASAMLFDKAPHGLTDAEAAVLAALPKAPSYYNPRRYPQRALRRRNLVIGLLADAGYLAEADAERWKAWPLQLSSRSDFSGVAQYFVEYVRQQLEARFGGDLYRSGYRIYTTIDLDMQQAAERALEAQLQAIEGCKEYGRFAHPSYR
jgi:membrane peptidoglycan carboxypeptidase